MSEIVKPNFKKEMLKALAEKENEIAELRETIANMRSTYYVFKNLIKAHEKEHGKLKGIYI